MWEGRPYARIGGRRLPAGAKTRAFAAKTASPTEVGDGRHASSLQIPYMGAWPKLENGGPLSRVLLVAVTLVLTTFAGCVIPLLEGEPGDAGPQSIVKKAVLTIDPGNEGGDAIEDFLKVSFEYTHMGASVASADLTAEYTAANGDRRTRQLSSFTSKTTLEKGDVVTIPGANITSGLLIQQGQDLIAGRANPGQSWFMIDGVPVPAFSSQAGQALYKITSSAGFSASGSDFDIDDTHVNTMSANIKGAITGDLRLTTSLPATSGPRMEVKLIANPTLEVDVSASLRDSEGTYEAGAKTRDMAGTFDITAMAQFDRSFELQKTGFGYDAFFDGRAHVWDREHPKSQNFEPEEIEHPMLDEDMAYEESDFTSEGEGPEGWIVNFLQNLWSAEVGVGDDYRVHFSMSFDDGGASYDLIIQITADEPRTVGGHTYPSYRVSQTANLIVDPPNRSETTFDLIKTTYWVDKQSHLPVYAQGTYTRNFNRDDIQKFLDTLGEEAPVTVPANAALVLQGDQLMELQGYSGNLNVAPLFGLILANPSDIGGAMPGVASLFFLMGGMGESSSSEPAPMPVPGYDFTRDEANDQLTVAVASSDAEWSRTMIQADQDFSFRLNGGSQVGVPAFEWRNVRDSWQPMQAGDVIQLCVQGALPSGLFVSFQDAPTNTMMGQFNFDSVDMTC